MTKSTPDIRSEALHHAAAIMKAALQGGGAQVTADQTVAFAKKFETFLTGEDAA
ncbi:hypothetical protein SK224_08090 [Microbacterium sp. BG28]|uniref:hypothetical protein n=1 Tax=Microbacterium sp. BG28 TaxID=3097356 RepID=UPI002A5A3563|nr:hypothetical protein [Microbacterium sp. BG28]MDY0829087.1 hypothetical protein [Microbacterium sp. BG28]